MPKAVAQRSRTSSIVKVRFSHFSVTCDLLCHLAITMCPPGVPASHYMYRGYMANSLLYAHVITDSKTYNLEFGYNNDLH